MMTRLLFLGFFIACINFCTGQNGSPQLKNVIPPSPTVASLGKYGEIPVGLYTGTPNISIPLYEIKDGPLSVPISLSYHAAGIRVEEIASDVGLGWTLNAGGVLGRQIRGRADEYGWIKAPQDRISTIIQSGIYNGNNGINAMAQLLNLGSIDGEADLYYYNINGRSGKFLFDEGGALYNYPAENVSIQPMGGTINFGTGWEVVTEDGTIYEFNKPELVYTSTCIGCEGSDNYTAWYLTKITSADGKRHIDFIYDFIAYNVETPVGETRNYSLNPGNCLPPYVNTVANSYYQTWQLSRINFSGGHVDFIYDDNIRQDFITNGPYALKEIIVKVNTSTGSKQIKSYELDYTYFGATHATTYEKRLKLTSLTETTPNDSKPPHLFSYEESIQMPTRFSPNKDHWGYYNGANNTTMIPKSNTVYNYGPYADRSANEDTMQACILKKITYPTGGETLFTYETNQSTDPRIEVAEYTETTYHIHDDQPWSSLSSPYESDTFVVPIGDEVEVSIYIEGVAASGSVNNCDGFYWYLLKDGIPTSISGNIDQIWDATTVELDLEPGTYKFRFEFYCWRPESRLTYHMFAKVLTPVENNGTVLRHAGGLRIKQMEDRPADGGPPVIKNYRYPVGGSLVNFPDYNAHSLTVNVTGTTPVAGGGSWCSVSETCNYWVASSTTNYPLATTNGCYVGYSKVIEDLGENGEIEHDYNTFTTAGNGQFPFPPVETSEWTMGRETQTLYYLVDGNGNRIPQPIKKVSYDYIGTPIEAIASYRSSSQTIYIGPCNTGPDNPFITYYVVPQFYYLSGMTERIYDQNDPSKWVETATQYKYDPVHNQQKEVVTSVSGSDGTLKDQLVVKRKFPQDYNTANASGSESLGIKKLNELHIVNVPIEEYTIRQKVNTANNQVTDARVVSGVITTFKQNDPYPDKILRLEKSNAMSLANFGTGSTISNNLFVKNANATVSGSYTSAIEFNSFDDKGNLTMQRQTDGTYTSYIWGYNGQYPIAKLENLIYTSIPSGTLTDLRNKANADNDRTIGSTGNEGLLRAALESLRTSLPNSMVTTYTYDPLVGVTSMTDPKGYTVYYEYDDLNRLEKVRDASGKLLSTNEYRYKNQ